MALYRILMLNSDNSPSIGTLTVWAWPEGKYHTYPTDISGAVTIDTTQVLSYAYAPGAPPGQQLGADIYYNVIKAGKVYYFATYADFNAWWTENYSPDGGGTTPPGDSTPGQWVPGIDNNTLIIIGVLLAITIGIIIWIVI